MAIDQEEHPGADFVFDETWHLQSNRDVAEAVERGGFPSGLDHYLLYGRAEGRSPVPPPDTRLVSQFESLGDDCELGFVQRSAGAEPLGLLRFAGSSIDHIVIGLNEGFSGITDGLEALDGEPPGKEWSIHAPRYDIRWHSFTSPADATQAETVERQSKLVRFLVRIFMEDVALGEKIFVVKRLVPLEEREVTPLFHALRRIGPSRMLWTSVDAERAGQVDVSQPGLFRGYLSRFMDPRNVPATLQTAEWLRVMRRVVSLCG